MVNKRRQILNVLEGSGDNKNLAKQRYREMRNSGYDKNEILDKAYTYLEDEVEKLQSIYPTINHNRITLNDIPVIQQALKKLNNTTLPTDFTVEEELVDEESLPTIINDDMNFNQAFGTARKAGLKEFTWRGKPYAVKMETSKQTTPIPSKTSLSTSRITLSPEVSTIEDWANIGQSAAEELIKSKPSVVQKSAPSAVGDRVIGTSTQPVDSSQTTPSISKRTVLTDPQPINKNIPYYSVSSFVAPKEEISKVVYSTNPFNTKSDQSDLDRAKMQAAIQEYWHANPAPAYISNRSNLDNYTDDAILKTYNRIFGSQQSESNKSKSTLPAGVRPAGPRPRGTTAFIKREMQRSHQNNYASTYNK